MMRMMIRIWQSALLLQMSFSAVAFTTKQSSRRSLSSLSSDNNGGPTFPSSFAWHTPAQQDVDEDESLGGSKPSTESQGQANTRFSKFAPDPNLDAEDFRLQLRENMKADLERRRNEDPNRGNQIAKSYLDSL